MVMNKDARPEAYAEMKSTYRPSHADFTYEAKYGIRNWEGGGRSSARETIGRVAAGAVAKKILRETFGVEVLSYVKQVQKIAAKVEAIRIEICSRIGIPQARQSLAQCQTRRWPSRNDWVANHE